MTMEQYMLLATILGFIFIIAELWQVYALRKTVDRAVSDPEFAGIVFSNAIHGFIGELAKDEEKQQNFFGVMQIIGQNIMAGATGGGAPNKPVKLKGMARILEPFINSPQLHGMVMEKVGQGIANTGKKGVEKAGEAAVSKLFG